MIFNACVQFICQIPAAPLMTLVNVNSYLRLNPEAIIRKEDNGHNAGHQYCNGFLNGTPSKLDGAARTAAEHGLQTQTLLLG